MDKITVTAKTYDEAITKALIGLQTTSDHMVVDIIEKGSAGLFGMIGARPWTIQARVKTEEEEAAEQKAAAEKAAAEKRRRPLRRRQPRKRKPPRRRLLRKRPLRKKPLRKRLLRRRKLPRKKLRRKRKLLRKRRRLLPKSPQRRMLLRSRKVTRKPLRKKESRKADVSATKSAAEKTAKGETAAAVRTAQL